MKHILLYASLLPFRAVCWFYGIEVTYTRQINGSPIDTAEIKSTIEQKGEAGR